MNVVFLLILPGSIPSTGRKDARTAGAGSAGASAALMQHSGVVPPVSAATSLQYQQLIGGAISPNLFTGMAGAGGAQPQTTASNLVMGDYGQGYVLNSQAANVMRQ